MKKIAILASILILFSTQIFANGRVNHRQVTPQTAGFQIAGKVVGDSSAYAYAPNGTSSVYTRNIGYMSVHIPLRGVDGVIGGSSEYDSESFGPNVAISGGSLDFALRLKSTVMKTRPSFYRSMHHHR